MEYGESLINGGVTYQHKCECCGCEKHNVQGAIQYAYLFLESLPFYPVGRSVTLECAECLHITKPQDLDSALYKQLLSSVFTIYHFVLKFFGLFLVCYLMFSWWQSEQEESRITENLVSYPQINDFMLLDFRKISKDMRPHEIYRIAKVVDITGNTVSLAFGNFFYKHESSFEDAIMSGQTRAYSYFGKNNHNFSIAQLATLLEREAIVRAARPEGNMLFGNYVINDTGYRMGSTYIPGERKYASGLAFEQATYIQEHNIKAFFKFEESANLGFALGQIRLAELYLAGEIIETDLSKALYWLEQASMQSYERAIKKYSIVCQQTKGCDVQAFYSRLIDAGVNLSVNERKGEVALSD
ncbi:sel1 repeat family protein [Thalassotalea sp. M1531]|uniref:Sel1 repeat family protein n=1 Tax=Thalassotalea algicola TaxID=2716224 RepID=A0A7Y0LGF3_9GAMM|nr:sel1 repeat family protein [Thalassotalea algicola]NMP33181.1 sel1 repeat family protein [Thalassotalea algicola]